MSCTRLSFMHSLHVDVFKRGPMKSSCHNQCFLDVFSFRFLFIYSKFSSLMCMSYHQTPIHSPFVFPITDKEEEETRHNTQPFYLYIIHEHSMMHMIHELCAFVDRVKCLKVTTDTNSLLYLECSSV